MTDAELQRLRGLANVYLDNYRISTRYYTQYAQAKDNVEAALREWWAQGCKDPAPPPAPAPLKKVSDVLVVIDGYTYRLEKYG